MPDISIQFHAAFDELISFAVEIVREFDLYVCAMRFGPFDCRSIDTRDVAEALERDRAYRRWEFTLVKPVTTVKNELEFVDRNPDHLRLDPGLQIEKGLNQSWLVARTTNADALAVWRKVAARIKRDTQAGVVAINPQSGARAVMKAYRYTAKAKAMEDQGVAMLPPAGTSVLKLGLSG